MFVSDAILGLNLVKFLLHLLNFAILFVCLWLILYKPVMKSIRARQERIQSQKDETEQNLKASEEAKEEAETRLKEIETEIETKRKESEKAATAKYDEVVNAASLRAAEIVKAAEDRAVIQANKAIESAKSDIKEMAVTLAETIIDGKIKDVDDTMIENAIKDWHNE